jgi:hypothetical protein
MKIPYLGKTYLGPYPFSYMLPLYIYIHTHTHTYTNLICEKQHTNTTLVDTRCKTICHTNIDVEP